MPISIIYIQAEKLHKHYTEIFILYGFSETAHLIFEP